MNSFSTLPSAYYMYIAYDNIPASLCQVIEDSTEDDDSSENICYYVSILVFSVQL